MGRYCLVMKVTTNGVDTLITINRRSFYRTPSYNNFKPYKAIFGRPCIVDFPRRWLTYFEIGQMTPADLTRKHEGPDSDDWIKEHLGRQKLNLVIPRKFIKIIIKKIYICKGNFLVCY